jgi:acetolactate decarboxylase
MVLLMTRCSLPASLLCALVFFAGCASVPPGKVTQFATIDALLAGVYDGDFTCAQVAKNGDLGLGTFDKLDGEMVVVDGRIYQVTADGTVRRAARSLLTPFATVTRFKLDRAFRAGSTMNMVALERALDRVCTNPNGVYSIRIRGEFPAIKLRSVAAQREPYRKLVDVVKEQTIFPVSPNRGTLVGFRFPEYFRGIYAPGYHLHFLSNDKQSGGHVLDVTVGADSLIEIAEAPQFELFFPQSEGTFSQAALSADRSDELRKVER